MAVSLKPTHSAQKDRLVAEHLRAPMAILPGWQIKVGNKLMTPVAVVPEPMGSREIGRSERQEAYAKLFVAAPDLLKALRALVAAEQDGSPKLRQKAQKAALRAIAKATR